MNVVNLKRKRFLEVSLKLIHEKGFKGTTMRDIATQLNCDVANVYNYVDSKQALLEEKLFEISGAFHESINNILISSYSPVDKLKAIVSFHIQLTSRRPFEVALLVNEWRNLKEPILSKFLEEKGGYEDKVRSIIKEGINSGVLRDMDLEIATFAMLSSIRWLHDKYTDPAKTVNPIELEKQISDFILEGMRA
ncbi:MAG: TetR family transcriptional regulator [Saprospiraceae bacterium]|jgi:AcrR family transcriptional regulator|nr:TetR family transcriptional regulator [Saprospiraceae bacterium]